VQARVKMGGDARDVAVPTGQGEVAAPDALPAHATPPAFSAGADGWTEAPLIRLAWGRSSDKGDTSNIGIIAARPEWVALLREQLTEARVKEWLAHLAQGEVQRYEVPGIHSFNFLYTQALDGGRMASLRKDPLGNGMAQVVSGMPVLMPSRLGTSGPSAVLLSRT
jgi:hypothetical protein